MSTTDHIKHAAELVGSQVLLAQALGVTRAQVNQWVQKEGKQAPPPPIKYCVAIERITCGAVTRQDLRPDDWRDIWPELVESTEAQQ